MLPSLTSSFAGATSSPKASVTQSAAVTNCRLPISVPPQKRSKPGFSSVSARRTPWAGNSPCSAGLPLTIADAGVGTRSAAAAASGRSRRRISGGW